MPRRNTPGSLENWRKMSSKFPFRASFGTATCWDFDRPHPNLIRAEKVCRGGRSIIVFESSEVRDYFVDGHMDQGAQAEPDWSSTASRFRDEPRPVAPSPSELEEADAMYRDALAELKRADALMEQTFTSEVRSALDRGDPDGAIAIIASIPSEALAKTHSMSILEKSQFWESHARQVARASHAPMTPERAWAALEWQRARRKERHLESVYGSLVTDHVQRLLDEHGRDAAIAFADTLPGGWVRAAAKDKAAYGRPSEQSSPANRAGM